MTAVIEAEGLTKRFGDVRALDGLDLVAQSGQVTALPSPSGCARSLGWPASSRRSRPR